MVGRLVPDGRGPESFLDGLWRGWIRASEGTALFGQCIALNLSPATGRILDDSRVIDCFAGGVEVGVAPDGAKRVCPLTLGLAGVEIDAGAIVSPGDIEDLFVKLAVFAQPTLHDLCSLK